MKLSKTPMIERSALQQRIREMALELEKDYQGRDPILLCVLKGAVPFTRDLLAAMKDNPFTLDHIRAKSYEGTESTGHVKILVEPVLDLSDRHVLLVEDILDTGRTLDELMKYLKECNPASLTLCTLLDKPERRIVPATADYTGFSIDDHFVVGYGLDYDESYRELDSIYTMVDDEG